MEKFKIVLLAVVLALVISGCQQSSTSNPLPTLQISGRSPALNATVLSASHTLSATFLFEIIANDITKENLLTEYAELASDHTAGNPTIISLVWSSDAKTITLEIAGWTNQSTLESRIVHIIPRAGKIIDVFDNDLYTSVDVWKYTLGPVTPGTPTTTTTTTTLPKVAAPTFVVAAGDYESNTLEITIECATDWVGLRYTTDESTPTQSSRLYNNSFTINRSQTIKVVGYKTGYQPSDMASATYNLTWWQPLGSGVNNDVYGVTGGSVYACGVFTDAGGVGVSGVAMWDGNNWHDMDGGVDNFARAAERDNFGNVYIGGDFGLAGSVSVKGIAKWNGSSWSALGNALASGRVQAIAVDDSGNVYIGGSFLTVEGTTVNRIAMWDGSNWSALGSGTPGVDNDVHALVYDNGNDVLYVGGGFLNAGGSTANRIAKWNSNTNSWSTLGNGFNSSVWSLAFDGTNLYAGGFFRHNNLLTEDYNRVAKWDGVSWSPLGDGLNSLVAALELDDAGNLYAGGNFTASGSENMSAIAKWDGNSWSEVGGGIVGQFSYIVNALDFYDSKLYAAGEFHTSGGVSTENIAVWGKK
jgi:hypothetical protein